MKNEYVRIASNIPGLEEKLKINIFKDPDMVHWYIKFNQKLDPSTVSAANMLITDIDGYILKADISYSKEDFIVMSPLESYNKNEYYILKATKGISSASGIKLKRELFIMFKLLDNKISNYKVITDTSTIKKPKERPPDYDPYKKTHINKGNQPNVEKPNPTKPANKNAGPKAPDEFVPVESIRQNEKLPTVFPFVNLFVGFLGLIMCLTGAFSANFYIILIGILFSVIGILHIGLQLSGRVMRSILAYNKGAKFHNRKKYILASYYFQRALKLDPDNKYALYATGKTRADDNI